MAFRYVLLVCALVGCRPAHTASGDGEETPKLAEHHRVFMNACAKRGMTTEDYCECGWRSFHAMFSEEEMSSANLAKEKMAVYKKEVGKACAHKIPEELVHSGYASGCEGERADMKSYCECTWTGFRQYFSPGELADGDLIETERFASAKVTVVRGCAGEFPEAHARESFMRGCAKEKANQNFCNCAWKALRKQVSAAEIAADIIDQKTAFPPVEAECGHLRAPKN